MDKNKLIALTVLGIFGFLIFNEYSDGKVVSLLNVSFYYIFLFIFILIAGVLGIGLALGAFIFVFPFALWGGFIYFLFVGEYFLAFVWLAVGTFMVSFISGDLTRKKK